MEARVRLIYFRAVLGHCRKFAGMGNGVRKHPVWSVIADPAGGFFKQLRYC